MKNFRPIMMASNFAWRPMPFLLSAIQITPTGLFGPDSLMRDVRSSHEDRAQRKLTLYRSSV